MRVMTLVLVIVCVACTKPNPNFCEGDGDCLEAARPFCDIEGEYAESGFIHNVCSPRPANCAVERCGCTPGEGLTCQGDESSVCGQDGRSRELRPCVLGCASESRCLQFTPSNNLAEALESAYTASDVIIPPGSTIETSTGTVLTEQGSAVDVPSVLVPQTGAREIRVFMAHSFELNDLTIRGPYPAAFVAAGAITIQGLVDAAARGPLDGPGAHPDTAGCTGRHTQEQYCGQLPLLLACSLGASGAGNVTAGGAGGTGVVANEPVRAPLPGGVAASALTPLAGGCRGGDVLVEGAAVQRGGGGGGAVQLVSATRITFASDGFLHVGGGGGAGEAGRAFAGGGSGGNALLEAPIIEMVGASTGLAANGGAGAACAAPGADATRDLTVARAPRCMASGGDGATKLSAPGPGIDTCPSGTGCEVVAHFGAGGGALGRVRFVTASGQVERTGAPVVSADETVVTLVAQ